MSTHIGHRGEQRTNTAPAVEAVKTLAAERAVDDPAKLDRATRIVRTALARDRLALGDLVDEEYVRRVVDGAPPLTAEQRASIAALFARTGGAAAA